MSVHTAIITIAPTSNTMTTRVTATLPGGTGPAFSGSVVVTVPTERLVEDGVLRLDAFRRALDTAFVGSGTHTGYFHGDRPLLELPHWEFAVYEVDFEVAR